MLSVRLYSGWVLCTKHWYDYVNFVISLEAVNHSMIQIAFPFWTDNFISLPVHSFVYSTRSGYSPQEVLLCLLSVSLSRNTVIDIIFTLCPRVSLGSLLARCLAASLFVTPAVLPPRRAIVMELGVLSDRNARQSLGTGTAHFECGLKQNQLLELIDVQDTVLLCHIDALRASRLYAKKKLLQRSRWCTRLSR
jgi:hypothetical protein